MAAEGLAPVGGKARYALEQLPHAPPPWLHKQTNTQNEQAHSARARVCVCRCVCLCLCLCLCLCVCVCVGVCERASERACE